MTPLLTGPVLCLRPIRDEAANLAFLYGRRAFSYQGRAAPFPDAHRYPARRTKNRMAHLVGSRARVSI